MVTILLVAKRAELGKVEETKLGKTAAKRLAKKGKEMARGLGQMISMVEDG